MISQVYIDNKQIYHFGEFNKEGKGEYKGWPWHLIPLSQNDAGKYIYFRIFSNYEDIGLFGEIFITSKGDLYEKC